MTQLKPRLDNLLLFLANLLISIGTLIWIASMLIKRPTDLVKIEAIVAYLGFAIIVIIPLILSSCYLYVDLTKKVIIDEKNKALIIKKSGKDTIITRHDILDSCIIRTKKYGFSRSSFPLYRYVILVLSERRRIFITNLLCEPEYIMNVLNLKNNVVETTIPFLDWKYGNGILTTKEFESKVIEYETLFQDHTDKTLNNIVLQKETYADYAREAAKRILKKREMNTTANSKLTGRVSVLR